MSIRWSCTFSYSAIILSICYGILLIFILTCLARLAWRTHWIQRRPQKAFLLAVATQSIGRITYFIWWPIQHNRPEDPCDPGTDDEATENLLTNILGTGPPLLFLIAFSVNVHTFARIYHNVLIPALYPLDMPPPTTTTTTTTDPHTVTVQPIGIASPRTRPAPSPGAVTNSPAVTSTPSSLPPSPTVIFNNNHKRYMKSQIQWRFFQICLLSVNMTICTLGVLPWFLHDHAQSVAAYAELWALSLGVFFVAAAFFVYALLLYYGIKSKLEQAPGTLSPSGVHDPKPIYNYNSLSHHREQETLYDPFLGVLHQISLHDDTILSTSPPSDGPGLPRQITPPMIIPNPQQEPRFEDEVVLPLTDDELDGTVVRQRPQNPMRKLVIVAFICLGCFCVRSILLPIVTEFSGGQFTWYNLPLYFLFSELIPMTLMLHIFDLSSEKRTAVTIPSEPDDHVSDDEHPSGGMYPSGWTVQPHYYGYDPTTGPNYDDDDDFGIYGIPNPPTTTSSSYSRLPSSHSSNLVSPVSHHTPPDHHLASSSSSSLASSRSSSQSYSDNFRQTLRNALH